MNFRLDDQTRMMQELARRFAREEIAPGAAAADRDASFPMQIHTRARELGLAGLTIPQAYGGPGLGAFELCVVNEELSWACLGINGTLGLQNIVADVFLVAGNEAQKKEAFGRLLNGEFGAYAVTEPAAGSDVAAIKTRAERRGGEYVINGSKTWISNAPLASFFVVFAKTDSNAGRGGISALLVPRDTPGLSVGLPLGKLGQKAAPVAEVFLQDVVVPSSALIDGEGQGFAIAMKVFDRSRPMVASSAVGLTQRCLDESLGYARERRTMGRPIIEHQAIGHKIAQMAMHAEAGRLLYRQASWLLDQGERNTLFAAYAKAFAADQAVAAASECVQVFGGMGYSTEFPAEKLYRDAKVLQIYEGSSEIQRVIMARELART
jgi:acyl-CoA dehydrogenase